jgi:hypothetical protein
MSDLRIDFISYILNFLDGMDESEIKYLIDCRVDQHIYNLLLDIYNDKKEE